MRWPQTFPPFQHARRLGRIGWIAALALPVVAQAALPPEVSRTLKAADVPADAISIVVQPLAAPGARTPRPRLQYQADLPRNPASLFKLFTTAAALDLLGPAYTWPTAVWLTATPKEGVLEGDVVIKGNGDPSLVLERIWLLLRRVQQLGVSQIHGDIVLDRGAFAPGDGTPGDFDGEPLRPYNVQANALLLNYASVVYTFTPMPGLGVARVSADPDLGTSPRQVPLRDGPCADWRAQLNATFDDTGRGDFAGRYPAACGERQWPVAAEAPARYDAALIASLWHQLGGQLQGSVHDGLAPATAPTFTVESPPLAQVLRDINKYSNNVMAQQVFLTLGLVQRGSGTPAAARGVLAEWATERLGDVAQGMVVDNGAGLSRNTRVTARQLARLLQTEDARPWMPEWLSSLPISATDGTLAHADMPPGCAHLKTGTLRDTSGLAGIALADSGRRYLLVALVNHPHAQAARPALDALVRWTCHDTALH